MFCDWFLGRNVNIDGTYLNTWFAEIDAQTVRVLGIVFNKLLKRPAYRIITIKNISITSIK